MKRAGFGENPYLFRRYAVAFLPVIAVASCSDGPSREHFELGPWRPDVVVDDALHDFDVQEFDSGNKPILPDGFEGFGDAVARETSQEDVYGSDAWSDLAIGIDYGYDYGHDEYSWDYVSDEDSDHDQPWDTWPQDIVAPDSGYDFGQTDVIADSSNPCEVDWFEYDGDPDNARELKPGNNASGSICPSGDIDVFWFTVESTSSVMLQTSGSGGDSTLTLLDAYGAQIEFDDDGGPDRYSLIVIDDLAPGTYFAVVAAYQDGVLNYDLSLVIDAGVVEPSPDVITDY